jgi:hypothetical protein
MHQRRFFPASAVRHVPHCGTGICDSVLATFCAAIEEIEKIAMAGYTSIPSASLFPLPEFYPKTIQQ